DTFYVGQAISLEVIVRDYCGNYVDNQAVSVSFSNLDKGQALLSVGRGAYQGTWTPANLSSTAAQSVITLQAIASPSFTTNYRQGGSAPLVPITVSQPLKTSTVVSRISNSGSYSPEGQVAPCTWVSIIGENLADAKVIAAQVPLSGELANASAQLGAQSLP